MIMLIDSQTIQQIKKRLLSNKLCIDKDSFLIDVAVDVSYGCFFSKQDEDKYKAVMAIDSLLCNNIQRARIDDREHKILSKQLTRSVIRGYMSIGNSIYFCNDMKQSMFLLAENNNKLRVNISAKNKMIDEVKCAVVTYEFNFIEN